MKIKRVLWEVKGDVQGVGYRYFTMHQAERLSITGWVQNMVDVTVAIEAEGTDFQLDEFLSLLKKGPRFADVTEVITKESEANAARQHSHFFIR